MGTQRGQVKSRPSLRSRHPAPRPRNHLDLRAVSAPASVRSLRPQRSPRPLPRLHSLLFLCGLLSLRALCDPIRFLLLRLRRAAQGLSERRLHRAQRGQVKNRPSLRSRHPAPGHRNDSDLRSVSAPASLRSHRPGRSPRPLPRLHALLFLCGLLCLRALCDPIRFLLLRLRRAA